MHQHAPGDRFERVVFLGGNTYDGISGRFSKRNVSGEPVGCACRPGWRIGSIASCRSPWRQEAAENDDVPPQLEMDRFSFAKETLRARNEVNAARGSVCVCMREGLLGGPSAQIQRGQEREGAGE